MSTLVDKGVEVWAVLVVMLALDVAFVCLKDLQIEVFDNSWLTSFLADYLKFVK